MNASGLTIELPYQWDLRDYQRAAWSAFESGKRRFCLVWHRRAGKDLFAINLLATAMAERVGLYWHVLPTYKQGRKIVWEGKTRAGRPFLDHIPPEIITRSREDEMMLWLAIGCTYQIVGSDYPD